MMDYKKSVGGINLIPLITNLDILYALYVNYDKKCRQYRISSLYIIVIKRLMPSRANQRFMEIISFEYLLTYFIPSHIYVVAENWSCLIYALYVAIVFLMMMDYKKV